MGRSLQHEWTNSPPQMRRGGAKRQGGVDQPIDVFDQHHPSLGLSASAFPSSSEEGSGPRVAFRLLIVFLIILYSNIAIAYPELNVVRPALVVAVGAILMLIIEMSQARQAFRFMWPQGALLVAFLAACFMSSFSGFWPGFAFGKTADFAKIVLIYVVIENAVTNSKRLRTILMTMVLGGVIPAVGTIHHYVHHILREGRAIWIGVWANPNEDAYGLVVLIPIAAALAMKSRWPTRIALGAIIATYMLAIYLTYSRGALLGLIAVVGLAGWKQKSAAVRTMMVLALGGLLLVGGMYWQRTQSFHDIRNDSTVNERIGTFVAGWRMFQSNPLLGVGPGDSMFAYPIYAPEYARCGCQAQLVVHNSFIQVLGETGLLGFLPFMLLLGFSVFHAWKLQHGPLNIYATALELSFWGFLVCSLSGGYSYTWWPYILMALIVATKHMAVSNNQELTNATI